LPHPDGQSLWSFGFASGGIDAARVWKLAIVAALLGSLTVPWFAFRQFSSIFSKPNWTVSGKTFYDLRLFAEICRGSVHSREDALLHFLATDLQVTCYTYYTCYLAFVLLAKCTAWMGATLPPTCFKFCLPFCRMHPTSCQEANEVGSKRGRRSNFMIATLILEAR
jgi:hypothetical protein